MKLRKILLAILAFMAISSYSFSQTYSAENSKSLIRTIWLTYMANGSDGCLFIEPDTYINESGSNNIIGQNFITYNPSNNSKFEQIILKVENGKITGAKLNTSEVLLTWGKDQVSKLKIEGVAYCNYALSYNATGEVVGLTSNEKRNDKVTTYAIEYKDGKIDKVSKHYDKIGSKKPWLNSVTTYTYNQNGLTINCIIYKRDKSPKPENIGFNITKNFIKVDDHNLKTEEKNFKNELTFDENNILISKKFLSYGRLESHTFKYVNGQLFSDENITTKDNAFIEKIITVNFSLENQPESVPNYQKSKGVYKFDQNNELIFEKCNGKYREKVNGSWSDWKNTLY